MQRWTPIAGCLGQAEGTHVTWADHCNEVEYQVDDMQKHACQMARERDEMMVERNNAEKREYEVLGRANALETKLKATLARLDVSDDLLREAFAQQQDALATLREIGDFAPEHPDKAGVPVFTTAMIEAIYAAWHGAGVDIAGGNWASFVDKLPSA